MPNKYEIRERWDGKYEMKKAPSAEDQAAAGLFGLFIILLFGVFLIIGWLFKNYPKQMGILLLLLFGGGLIYVVGYSLFNPNQSSNGGYYPSYSSVNSSSGGSRSGTSSSGNSSSTSTSSGTNTGATRSGSSNSSSSGSSSNGTLVSTSGIQVDSTVEVTTYELKVHVNPGLSEIEIGTVKQGKLLYVHGGPAFYDGRIWWQVSGWDNNGTMGWCSERFLQLANTSSIQVGSKVEVTGVISPDMLNIREQAGTTNKLIGKANNGYPLRVVGGPTTVDGRNWWQVTGWDAAGTAGWCSGKYLKVVQ